MFRERDDEQEDQKKSGKKEKENNEDMEKGQQRQQQQQQMGKKKKKKQGGNNNLASLFPSIYPPFKNISQPYAQSSSYIEEDIFTDKYTGERLWHVDVGKENRGYERDKEKESPYEYGINKDARNGHHCGRWMSINEEQQGDREDVFDRGNKEKDKQGINNKYSYADGSKIQENGEKDRGWFRWRKKQKERKEEKLKQDVIIEDQKQKGKQSLNNKTNKSKTKQNQTSSKSSPQTLQQPSKSPSQIYSHHKLLPIPKPRTSSTAIWDTSQNNQLCESGSDPFLFSSSFWKGEMSIVPDKALKRSETSLQFALGHSITDGLDIISEQKNKEEEEGMKEDQVEKLAALLLKQKSIEKEMRKKIEKELKKEEDDETDDDKDNQKGNWDKNRNDERERKQQSSIDKLTQIFAQKFDGYYEERKDGEQEDADKKQFEEIDGNRKEKDVNHNHYQQFQPQSNIANSDFTNQFENDQQQMNKLRQIQFYPSLQAVDHARNAFIIKNSYDLAVNALKNNQADNQLSSYPPWQPAFQILSSQSVPPAFSRISQSHTDGIAYRSVKPNLFGSNTLTETSSSATALGVLSRLQEYRKRNVNENTGNDLNLSSLQSLQGAQGFYKPTSSSSSSSMLCITILTISIHSSAHLLQRDIDSLLCFSVGGCLTSIIYTFDL
ncbi:MAG: hypothetical protein EZS28_010200 [Streblomastix strix]|uniref:Uncharacterized protein n=1 Tax=Streblomastix strix TaxID=222440 RepID=A0A5J4WGT2_9EUKA|nr:MAG: hypothetical protein EZS28_010200 [Streblomastix strix]